MMELDNILLLKYLQNECSPEELCVIGQWLGESARNREVLFALEMAWEAPSKAGFACEADVNAAWEALNRRIAERAAVVRRTRRRNIWLVVPGLVAAAVLAALLMLPAVRHLQPLEKRIVVTVAEGQPVKIVVLPDNTLIWVNGGSTLSYPKAYGADDRRVYLDGEAYFEVVKNPSSPFVVSSKSMITKVYGTSFNIADRAGDPIAQATLIEGSIEVKGRNDEGRIILSPGQRAEIALAAGHMRVVNVSNPGLDAVWHDDLIPFHEASLSEIARTLEKLYGVNIEIKPDLYNDRLYTGVIRKKGSVGDVLGSLRNSVPMTYRVEGNRVTITPAP